MLVDAFGNHCNFAQYTPKYHPHDHKVKDIQRYGTLSILSSGPNKPFIVHIKQAAKNILQRIRTKTMKTIGVLKRGYEKASSYKMKKDYAKSEWSDERLKRTRTSGLHIERDVITIKFDEMARTTTVCVRKNLIASFKL